MAKGKNTGGASALPTVEEINEMVAEAEARMDAAEAKQTDLTSTGRDRTVVETLTVVEDYTDAPAPVVTVAPVAIISELDNGTIMEDFSGSPEAEAE